MEILLKPVGVVISNTVNPGDMPIGGLPARIDVFSEYSEALKGLEENSHVWIIAWFHKAPRNVLRTAPLKVNPDLPEYGVFALRAYARPNPIGLCLAELEKVEGNCLYVKGLDAIDGTPVLDIKPYYENDIIFSPDTPYIRGKTREMRKGIMKKHAYNHHREYCRDLCLAVRMSLLAEDHFGKVMNDNLHVTVYGSNCLGDCIQGITRARLSNPLRFDFQECSSLYRTIWAAGGKTLSITMQQDFEKDEIKNLSDETLFRVEMLAR